MSNLASALPGDELGRFDDLHTLTAFADNLVPHVLKVAGVLVVDPALDARSSGRSCSSPVSGARSSCVP